MAKGCKKCKEKLEDTCLGRVNARCVDYEGDLPLNLDESKCYTSHDILEELVKWRNDNNLDIDLGCLEIEPVDEEKGLTISEVFNGVISKLCESIETSKCNLSIEFSKESISSCIQKITATVSGGSGDYSYRWYVSDTLGQVIMNSISVNEFTIKNNSLSQNSVYIVNVDVTDNRSGCQLNGSVIGNINFCD